MVSENHWVLPQGIEEALPEQAAALESVRRAILDMYGSRGYELVMPPFIDHIESLLTGAGHDLDLQTFKLIDQVSGRTLGIRADMTPQVARIDAHNLKREAPTRLCYIGTVLRTRADSFGGSRSPLQLGAELYGHSGVASDVEMISLMLETFDIVGLDDVTIDLGNVDIFRGLAANAKLGAQTESALFELLQSKAVTEIEALLGSLAISDSCRSMFAALPRLNGGAEVLLQAIETLADAGQEVLAALDYLQQVSNRIHSRYPEVKLHFDLAELTGYHYQTGVVFAAFTPQSGQAIARGGRYDAIGEVFGRARAATGFSSDLKLLVQISGRELPAPQRVFAPASDDPALQDAIVRLRAEGIIVIEELEGQEADAASMGCEQTLVNEDGEWHAR